MLDVLTPLLPGQGKRALTFEEQVEVEDVLDAALAWTNGELELGVAANLGGIETDGHPSAPYTRFVALRTTPRSDPRWQALDSLCTKLSRMSGYMITRQGVFTRRDMAESKVLHERLEGRETR